MNRSITILALLLILACCGLAQELPEAEDEQASQDQAEQVLYLQEHPVNLNHVDLGQLMSLPVLTPYQALRLEKYLRSHPNLNDPYLLVRDTVLGASAIESLLPYICFDSYSAVRSGSFRLSTRLQRKWPGNGDSSFYDSPMESRTRLWYGPGGGWEAFFQSQHDPGEAVWNDYYSGNVQWSDSKGRLIIGDYQVGLGRGLIFGGGSPEIFTSYWSNSGSLRTALPRPYYSSQEYRGLRGLCLQRSFYDRLDLLCFASKRRIDVKTDSLGQMINIYEDGYHRTESETARKNNSSETILGGRAGLSDGRSYTAGITGCRRVFDKVAQISPYNASLLGLDAGFMAESIQVLMELAWGQDGLGGYNGECGYSARNYSGQIEIYGYATAFGPPRFNSQNYYGGDDERGLTVNCAWEAPAGIKLSGIYNQFQPWQPFPLSTQGCRGFRYEIRVDRKYPGGVETEFKIRSLQKELFDDDEQAAHALYNTSNTIFRAGLLWKADKNITAGSKYQTSFYRDSRVPQKERGEMLSLSLKAGFLFRATVSGQSVFYDVSSYDARLYLNEPELRSGGSFHGYWGQGRRDALSLRWPIGKHGSLDLKIARQIRDYQGEISKSTEVGLELEILLK